MLAITALNNQQTCKVEFMKIARTKAASRFLQIIFDNVKSLLYAVLIALAFKSFLFQPFWIPSGSMKETLLIGDFILVNKMAYGYSRYSCSFAICPIKDRIFARAPKRGDIVVFRHPTKNEDYIKRLFGLPGDTLQLKGGTVYLNERPASVTRRRNIY